MNVTIFANEIIFPCLLFCLFSYFLIVRPEIKATQVDVLDADRQDSKDSLNDVYESIAQDDYWQEEFENISDRQSLVNILLAISASKGFNLTPSDINRSIEQHTDKSQADYICLPIGCWRVG